MEATVSTLTTKPRTLDLDKAIKEVEPLAVTYNDKTYPLPATITSRVILKHMGSLNADGGIALDKLEPFLSDLIGEDVLAEMVEDGLPYAGLEELLKWMLNEYGITPPADGEEDPNLEG